VPRLLMQARAADCMGAARATRAEPRRCCMGTLTLDPSRRRLLPVSSRAIIMEVAWMLGPVADIAAFRHPRGPCGMRREWRIERAWAYKSASAHSSISLIQSLLSNRNKSGGVVYPRRGRDQGDY
jgi:hypothetical protein